MEATVTTQTESRPQFLNVLCILSFIGSSLWALFSIIGIFASGWIMRLLGMGAAKAMEAAQANASNIDQAQATAAMTGVMGMGAGIIIAICVVSLILAAMSLFGVYKMYNLKKSGFIFYTIANGIMFLLSLLSFNILSVIIIGAFIGMYAANLKSLK